MLCGVVGTVRNGMEWYGRVRYGTVFGMVWYCVVWLARYGMVWNGMEWYGMVGTVLCLVWYGMVLCCVVWCGWHGTEWYGLVWYGRVR